MLEKTKNLLHSSSLLLLTVANYVLLLVGALLTWQIVVASQFYTSLYQCQWGRHLMLLSTCSVYLMLFAMTGFLGSFYRNGRLFVRMYVCLASLNVLVSLVILTHLPPEQMLVRRFELVLRVAQRQYNWAAIEPPGNRKPEVQSCYDNITMLHQAWKLRPDSDQLIEPRAMGPDEATRLWDRLQEQFQCCGIERSSDWQKYHTDNNNNTSTGVLPKSCCSPIARTTLSDGSLVCLASSPHHHTGCMPIIVVPMWMLKTAFTLALGITLIVCIVASLASLSQSHREEYEGV